MATKEMTEKKLKARFLLVMKGYGQKEIAKIVGVSEITLSKWVKKYEWKDAQTKEIKLKGGLNSFIEDFFAHVAKVAPSLLNELKTLWIEFQKESQNKIGL